MPPVREEVLPPSSIGGIRKAPAEVLPESALKNPARWCLFATGLAAESLIKSKT